MSKKAPSSEFLAEIRRLLDYNPDTGAIWWKVNRAGTQGAGSEAGTLRVDGYRIIRVCHHTFTAGQIAWFLGTGEWPTRRICFKDGIKSNTRKENMSHGPRQFKSDEEVQTFIHRKLPDAISPDVYWAAVIAARLDPKSPSDRKGIGDWHSMDHAFQRYFDHYGVRRPDTHAECAELVLAMIDGGPLS